MESPELQLPTDEATEAYLLVCKRHPHIGPRIDWFWGHREFPEFIHRLLLDSRDGKRDGFDWDVMRAFNVLQRTHDETFPEHATKWRDIWEKWYER